MRNTNIIQIMPLSSPLVGVWDADGLLCEPCLALALVNVTDPEMGPDYDYQSVEGLFITGSEPGLELGGECSNFLGLAMDEAHAALIYRPGKK